MILEHRIPAKYLLDIIKYELIIALLAGMGTRLLAGIFTDDVPLMPLAIPAFLGTSISVLLSFKMNQSYDRWWEARKLWGAIVNDSRSLILQLQSFVSTDQAPAIQKMAYRQIAWCYALGKSLRGQAALDNTNHLLTPTEQKAIAQHSHHPLAIMQLNARALQSLRSHKAIDAFGHIHIQETLTRLTDSMGGVERINRTIFPSTYRLVLHFIIYLFIITLAISLKNVSNLLVVPLLLLISAGFFFIEKIAFHLQAPFRNRPSDVPVTDIAETIEKNIRQLLGEAAKPEAIVKKSHYIL
ncbi:putative membrane protein [Filimonas zeae]|uniref:Bestrophin, RFP-TM, chloride channel n=1 Tax=Filimonas zeae TaxID=1737353 RepID=A0A917J027_9BACT|nr:bestrophin family ion channel [Filimonas zeae]MDR6339601.1 putative membrane protein [Filimonas zeae]GGH74268.1 hypothetical protein GCM10011379_36710 [Filimonas zeae]